MTRLTATFLVPLPAPILIRGDEKPRTYSNALHGFEVNLTISPREDVRSKTRNERLWTYICDELSISVSRDETVPLPEVRTSPGGSRDLSVRSPYFEQRLPEYQRVACQTLNNAISFLRFQLRQPLLRPVEEGSQHLQNPQWHDGSRARVDAGFFTFVVGAVPGLRGELGVTKLEPRHDKPLRAALVNPKRPSLHQEILSDAQAAAFEGNIRRAVLELAIACEVFAKHTFFGSADHAAQVFEALEDKGKMGVRVLELIDIGGPSVFGRSFRSFDRSAHTDIDHLFRARNKVVHRGEAVFRDDAGQLHVVTPKLIARWWNSLDRLFSLAG